MHPTRNSATLIINGSSGRVMPGVRRSSLIEVVDSLAMKGIAHHLKTALLVEVFVVPVVLLALSPHWPRTALGWALVVLFGPPLWFIIGYASSSTGELIPDDSVTSALYGVVFLLLLVGGYCLVWWLLGDYLRPHFY